MAEVMRSVQSARFERDARQKIFLRADIMRQQMAEGRAPGPELVVDDQLAELQPVRASKARHPSYRVTYSRGGVLHGYLLVPQRDGDVSVERVSVRLKRGTTVVEVPGGGHIDLHWAGDGRRE